MTRLDLRPHGEAGGAHDVGTRAVVGPRRRVQAAGDRLGHQRVVGGVVLDGVDAVAVAVVAVQLRLVLVGQLTPADHLWIAGAATPRGQLLEAPSAAERGDAVHQGDVRGGGVVALQRSPLVEDLVGTHRVSVTASR